MQLTEALLTGRHLSKNEAECIAAAAGRTYDGFVKLLGWMEAPEPILSKRAAWCFSLAAKLRPDWAQNCQQRLIGLLARDNPSDGLLRNTLRVLRDCSLHPESIDSLAYYCFEFTQDLGCPIAVRAFAMHILGKIGLVVPEIRHEVKSIIDYHFEEAPAGMRSAGKAVLRLWQRAGDVQ